MSQRRKANGYRTDDIVMTWPETRRFMLRSMPLAVFVGLLLGAAVLMLSLRVLPVTYQARAAIVIMNKGPSANQVGALANAMAGPLSINAYRTAATSAAVLRDALQALDGVAPSQAEVVALRQRLRVHPSIQENVTNDVLEIDATGASAARSADLADAVAGSLVRWDKARADGLVAENVKSLQQQIATVNARIAGGSHDAAYGTLITMRSTLRDRLAQAEVLQGASVSALSVIQSASLPTEPASPRPVLYTAVAFFVGLLGTYGLMLLMRS